MGPEKRPKGRISRIFAVGASSLVTCVVLHGLAGAQVLSNNNSVISFNFGSSQGMTNWVVDGNDQLNQQWIWFRIGSGSGQMDLSSISAPIVNFANPGQVNVLYSNSLYGAQISYTLTGNSVGSGKSALTEQINFFNYSSSSTLDLHLYVYGDYTLGGAAYANSQNVKMTSSPVGTSVQTVFGAPGLTNKIVLVSAPSRVEAALYPTTYNELTGGSDATLNNATLAGPGHSTWAFEWDSVLGTNSSLGNISITDTMQVPEPAAIGFGLMGLFMAWRIRRSV